MDRFVLCMGLQCPWGYGANLSPKEESFLNKHSGTKDDTRVSKLWTKTSIGSAIFSRILASGEGRICAEWGWFGIWITPPGSGSGLGEKGHKRRLIPEVEAGGRETPPAASSRTWARRSSISSLRAPHSASRASKRDGDPLRAVLPLYGALRGSERHLRVFRGFSLPKSSIGTPARTQSLWAAQRSRSPRSMDHRLRCFVASSSPAAALGVQSGHVSP